MAQSARHDVVVIGAGLAGLAAANRAAESGLRVVVLEQGAEDLYLCNTRMTTGVVHVAGEDMFEPPERLRGCIEAVTGGCCDPVLAQALAGDAARTVRWLKSQGVRFVEGATPSRSKTVLAPQPPRRPGVPDWSGRAGDVLLRTLTGRLAERGGMLLRGVRAVELVMREGACAGVAAVQDGSDRLFECSAVVIADGGFQSDPEMGRRHISPAPERLKQRNSGASRGDGARMARAAGAKLVGLDRFYGHLLYRGAMEDDRFWPYPTLDVLSSAAVVVDGSGRRFVDEGHGGTHTTNAVAALADPLSAAVVFDSAIWNGPGREYVVAPNPNLIEAGGALAQSQTLAGLAQQLGLPAGALQDTVAEYNDKLARGALGELTPPRSAHACKPWPIAAPPFLGVPVCAGATYTMGGIATDADGRVLRDDGSPIPGLFAAGSATGGLEGGGFTGYTGGLSKAAVFGLRAGECIARSLKAGNTVP